MSVVSQAPAVLDIAATKGDSVNLSFTVTDSGTPYNWSGATVSTSILDLSGNTVATAFTTTTPTSGTFTVALTSANTTTLGTNSYRYYLTVTKASITRTWLAGSLSLIAPGWGGAASVSAVSLASGTLSFTVSA